jgi:hypothetical protein
MMESCGFDSSVSGQVPVEGSCEHGNEPSGSIRCWEALEWLRKLLALLEDISLIELMKSSS